MKATTTEEKYRTILLFMGYIEHDIHKGHYYFPIPELPDEGKSMNYNPEEFKYKRSYSRLMPVWRKFRDLNTPVLWGDNLSKFHNMSKEIARSIVCENTPDKAFDLLVEAVEWYNSINDKKE